MDWFKRYGIPGAYFWGFLILWIWVLYDCKIDNIINNDAVMKVVIAGIIGSFLPIGYLISIFGQIAGCCLHISLRMVSVPVSDYRRCWARTHQYRGVQSWGGMMLHIRLGQFQKYFTNEIIITLSYMVGILLLNMIKKLN